jgi:hypothetical protein
MQLKQLDAKVDADRSVRRITHIRSGLVDACWRITYIQVVEASRADQEVHMRPRRRRPTLGRLLKAEFKKRVSNLYRKVREAMVVLVMHAFAYALGHTMGSLLLALIWESHVTLV